MNKTFPQEIYKKSKSVSLLSLNKTSPGGNFVSYQEETGKEKSFANATGKHNFFSLVKTQWTVLSLEISYL